MIHILQGDCRDVLRTLPDQSVHCVVTSPPYYNLRDYGVDGQMGLEETPEEFVAEMVAVFREVRRVLRDDGTCWVNLGSSYVSRDTNPNPSLVPKRVLSCDSGGRAPEGSSGSGLACLGSNGEPQGDLSNRRGRSIRSARRSGQTSQQLSPIARDSGLEGSSEAHSCDETPDVRASSTLSSPPSGPASSGREDKASTCPLASPTSSAGHQESFRNSDDSADIGMRSLPSARHMLDTELSARACDCGSCGMCWAYLAIPSLRLKGKDLLQIPHLVSLALQADGWYLRSEIIWHKPNPMPESVTDRPTKAHEQVFLLTKSARYFYDAEAIKEESVEPDRQRADRIGGASHKERQQHYEGAIYTGGNSRNARSVWTIATKPFPEAHFATFPVDLAERCIKAGTSLMGCCSACGAPRVRVVERNLVPTPKAAKKNVVDQRDYAADAKDQGANRQKDGHIPGWARQDITLGWSPSCQCNGEVIPCTVLDPFGGAGTTGLVADRLQRNAILIELNPEYAEMARRRISADAPLFGPTP